MPVPPVVVAVRVALVPLGTELGPTMLMLGSAVTVMGTETVLEQPFVPEPVTVYVVVVLGVAITGEPVLALKPVVGVQV